MSTKTLHHIATAAGFLWLIGWYYLCKELGITEWFVSKAPKGYEGALLMLSIGITMTPAFFLWSRFNRWVESRLKIEGKYFEDTVIYKTKESDDKK